MAYSIKSEKCTGCDACAVSCPVQAISGEHYMAHTIDPELCVSCGLCGSFCENSAVMNDAGRHADFASWRDWSIPRVDTEKCTGCAVCVEVCPMFALKISRPEHHGDIRTHAYLTDVNLCIGCKKCRDLCGIGAISMVPRNVPATEKHLSASEIVSGNTDYLFNNPEKGSDTRGY